MSNAEKYVTAAFLVVFAAVLLYVVIYAFKMARLQREIAELAELAERAGARAADQPTATTTEVEPKAEPTRAT